MLGDIDLPVLPVGVADGGMMGLPTTAYAVGWYEFGARPADRAGTTVLAGHVDTKAEGLGPLAALRGVDQGSEIVVTAMDGTSRRYRVTEVRGDPQGTGAAGADLRPGRDRRGWW